MDADPKNTREVSIELYDNLAASNPDFERKGKSLPCTARNGHMFTYISNTDSMGLRLPEEDREAFLEIYKIMLFSNMERL